MSIVLAEEDFPIAIMVEDIPLETDNPPFFEQNEIIAPVLDLARAMGLYASNAPGDSAKEDIWVDDEVYYTRLCIYISPFWNSGPRMEIAGGGIIDNTVPPKMIDDCVYVPLRPFADVFGYNVQWDEQTKTAYLTNKLNIPFFTGKVDNTKYSLINDRLFIHMPEGAEARNSHYGGIMGSSTNDDYETNLMLIGNDQTIEVKANELYAYSTGDLKKDAALFVDMLNNRYTRPAKYFISETVDKETLAFISLRPETYDNWSDFLIEGALVQTADNTLVFVGVYADQKAMKYSDDCQKLARQIINSLESGTRILSAEGQLFSMEGYSIKLVPGYIPKLNRGPDFDVWYFNKLTTLDDVGSSFGIYRGNHPSYDNSEKVTNTTKDIVLSRMITWRIYSETPGKFDEKSYAETIILTGIGGWDTYMHIFASPSSETDWKDIRKMVRSLNDVDGSATVTIWIFYGLILIFIFGIILLVIRKRKKAKRLMNKESAPS